MVARRPSLGAATKTFNQELNTLLNATITQQHLSPTIAGEIASLTFRQGGNPVLAPLRTAFGPMGLYIGQMCVLRPPDEEGTDLQTIKYGYALHNGTDRDAGQIIRWEYDRRPPPRRGETTPPVWCRRHFQGPLTLPLGGQEISLNSMHLPTGYVPIEDIIRYCIVDLGVKPLSSNWDEILTVGYKTFRQNLLSSPPI